MNGSFLAEETKNMFQGKTKSKNKETNKKTEEKVVACCIARIRPLLLKETEEEKFHEPAKPKCNIRQTKARMHLRNIGLLLRLKK